MSSSGKRGKSIGIGIIIGIVIGLVIGFGAGSPESSDDTTTQTMEENPQLSGEVKIGLILPLTGDLATHGEENCLAPSGISKWFLKILQLVQLLPLKN